MARKSTPVSSQMSGLVTLRTNLKFHIELQLHRHSRFLLSFRRLVLNFWVLLDIIQDHGRTNRPIQLAGILYPISLILTRWHYLLTFIEGVPMHIEVINQ